MQKIIYLFIILFLAVKDINSQNLYVSTSGNSIYSLNQDNSFSYLTTADANINDIAISETGDFYGILTSSLSSLKGIVHINIDNGETTVLANTEEVTGTSLTYGGDGDLYTIYNRSLYKYNISSNLLELVSNFDLSTPGDLSVYKGNIIFPNFVSGQNGNPPYSRIMAYNINNSSINEVFCLDNIFDAYGISNSFNSCEENSVTVAHGFDDFYNIDLDTGIITNLNIDRSNLDSAIVYGLASDNEYLAANCNTQLQSSNCNMLSTADFLLESSISIFPNPAKDILNIKSQVQVFSIEFYDITGKLIKKINNPKNGIAINDFEAGMYLLKLYANNSEKIIKWIKE
ncbi:T9SS type A sorting domain-containing protein [Olleya sp. HaHaR_3_96]|uniref:T9SS type A sorting domain-containing protein n=1 Tax=Olleya sp. HaHaR_3_96 TaxID=2745560 RepID=UPI001C4F311E|nr:T9SS type A sorting domain-containing protein [Olleya sp. HaHaR_3_96]QXP58751.1 T9SS type A sorting domain-containing protein [Olleya sp. HaHaR_3_96]